jgi:actin-related protein 5
VFCPERAQDLSPEALERRLQAEHQLHVAVERVRVPESLFQPALLGVDQAGLGETLRHVIAVLKGPERACLENVFVTGGCARLPHMTVRISF